MVSAEGGVFHQRVEVVADTCNSSITREDPCSFCTQITTGLISPHISKRMQGWCRVRGGTQRGRAPGDSAEGNTPAQQMVRAYGAACCCEGSEGSPGRKRAKHVSMPRVAHVDNLFA